METLAQAHLDDPWATLIAALVGALAGLVTALLSVRWQREKIRAEFGVERSVEDALKLYLGIPELRFRTFPMIRHHLGGFESNVLRRLLVRAGAVRFMAADGTELWALRKRVMDEYHRSEWKLAQKPLNKPPEGALFPEAFKDPSQY